MGEWRKKVDSASSLVKTVEHLLKPHLSDTKDQKS